MVWGLVPGGTLSVLRDWVPRLAGHGEVTILSLGPNRASLGVPTVALGGRWSHPLRFPQMLAYVARMAIAAARQARGGASTVLVPQDALATGAAAVIAAMSGRGRVAVMEHGSAEAVETDRFWRERSAGTAAALRNRLLRAILRTLNRFVLRRMVVALVAGNDAAATYRSRGVAEDRLLRYRFGVDLDRFRPATEAERADARRRWGVEGDRAVVVSVGRLAPEKGVDDLVRAVAALPEGVAPALLVAGDGPLRHELERAADAAAVAATFVGRVEPDDVVSVLHAADCFVYPARRGANTPFAVLEAMAAGLAVVATTAPAIHRSMLADGRGIAVEPGDRDALGDGVLAFMGDRPRAAAAGAAARRYVETHHSPAEADRAVDALVRRLWPESADAQPPLPLTRR
jgi:glycosyltransferase involved in cell wall biosynthesis